MPPLTPLDIQHKEFTKAMRGYAMHEVDTFLDQVTEEFTRLQDEVTRLREQAPGQQGGVPAQAAAPPPTPAVPAPQQAAAPPSDPRAGEEAIARALVMAQRMADQTVEEAKVKAKAMVSEAEARAKNVTEQAQLRAREVTEAAQMRAREVTETAQARARELTEGLETRYKERIQSAEARARVAEEQARMQIAQATEQVARRRQELESSIEALRAFERDYRARLRGFVEGQLKALEDAAPSGPVAPNPPPGMTGNNSRPLPGSEDLPALPTGARQVNNSYPLREGAGDQLGHNGRDRVDRLRHDD
jgi:DivIVA domain-containing protein